MVDTDLCLCLYLSHTDLYDALFIVLYQQTHDRT